MTSFRCVPSVKNTAIRRQTTSTPTLKCSPTVRRQAISFQVQLCLTLCSPQVNSVHQQFGGKPSNSNSNSNTLFSTSQLSSQTFRRQTISFQLQLCLTFCSPQVGDRPHPLQLFSLSLTPFIKRWAAKALIPNLTLTLCSPQIGGRQHPLQLF